MNEKKETELTAFDMTNGLTYIGSEVEKNNLNASTLENVLILKTANAHPYAQIPTTTMSIPANFKSAYKTSDKIKEMKIKYGQVIAEYKIK